MRRLVVAAVLAGAAYSANPVYAIESSGTIDQIDPSSRTMMMANGERYSIAPNVPVSDLREGKWVAISYDEIAGQRVASAVLELVTSPKTLGQTSD